MQLIRGAAYQPPMLPAAAQELLELAHSPNVSLQKVIRLIEAEATIAGEVLQTAQSSFYSRGHPVECLSQAVVRIGAKQLSRIFLEVSANAAIFQSEKYHARMLELQRHSMVVARVAAAMGPRYGVGPDRAYLCGLLHDVGIAAGLLVLERNEEEFRKVDESALIGELSSIHQQTSGRLAQRWNLSAEARWVLGHHHDFRAGEEINALAAVICVADGLAHRAGAAGPEVFDEKRWEDAVDHLEMSEVEMQRFEAVATEATSEPARGDEEAPSPSRGAGSSPKP